MTHLRVGDEPHMNSLHLRAHAFFGQALPHTFLDISVHVGLRQRLSTVHLTFTTPVRRFSDRRACVE